MGRKYYIDNLRIVLTALVVLHHLAIAYGGPGLWYYNEPNPSVVSSIILSLFVATNQAFFMGMFFMISAYFLHKSVARKSGKTILQDRLKRLGIPIVFYGLVISPIIVYLIARFDKGQILSVSDFFQTTNWFTFGPLWFIIALLLFTIVALILFSNNKDETKTIQTKKLPNNLMILGFAIGMAIVSFVLRIWFPVGWSLKPVGFQLGHFGQYIPLYVIGIYASKHGWFGQITYKQGIMWLRMVAVMVFILFPVVFYFGGAMTGGTEVFMGGRSIQSFVYCLWEQIVGVGIIVGLLGYFKEKYNYQKETWKEYSASAYTVYIIHAFILVVASLVIKNLDMAPIIKFVGLAPILLFVCFKLSSWIRKISFLRGIL